MTAEALYLALFGRGLRLRADDDGRLIVAPGGLLTDDDRVAIKGHRDELVLIVAYAATPSDMLPQAEPRREHDVPSLCLGPTACAAIGICGRASCASPAESDAFAVAMATARRHDNPHVVLDVYATEEVDRAA